jgi:hypothetical protein
LTEKFNIAHFPVLLCLLVFAMGSSVHARTDIPFEALYEVTVDGKPKMETRITLSKEGENWLLKSSSRGTRGIARMLKANSNEQSSGNWVNGRFQPAEFSHQSRVAGRDDQWTAHFDWPGSQLTTRHEDGESILPLSGPVFDPVSLTLALRNALESGSVSMDFDVVDEDEIDRHLYKADKPGQLDTRLGCFEVVPVERIRENSQRYSTGWYASTLSFIPVRLRHGKKGGKEFELRLIGLKLNGKEITARPDCPS